MTDGDSTLPEAAPEQGACPRESLLRAYSGGGEGRLRDGPASQRKGVLR